MDSEDMREVAFCPSYLRYKDKDFFCVDSKILVTSDFIQLEIPKGTIIDKWVINNIVYITSYLKSGQVSVAITAMTDGVFIPDSILEFRVGLSDWNRKLKEIRSLNDYYKSLLKNSIESEDTDSVPGHNESIFEEDIQSTLEGVWYPEGDADAIFINKRDFDTLRPEQFLNDTIIDFYFKYLLNELDSYERRRFHFLNSLFFTKMTDHVEAPLDASKARAAFQRVKHWTDKVNLLEKEFIFMPVNYNKHWSLIVIWNFGEVAKYEDGNANWRVPYVLHMDSLRGCHAGLKDFIHSYVREEWRSRQASEDISKFDHLEFKYLKELPQQQNGYDCGLFLLHYAQLFMERFLPCSNSCQVVHGLKFLKGDWFTPSEASDKRIAIRKLIYDLEEKQKSAINFANNYLNQVSCSTEDIIPLKCHGNSQDDQEIEISLVPFNKF